MPWIQCNINPLNKQVGDCSVRAISLATGQGWDDTYIEIAIVGLCMADMPSANAVTTAYLKRKGFRRKTIPDKCPDCYTVDEFCKDNPEGVYVVGIGTHLVTVIDGNYYDTWDSGNETPLYYFEKGD